MDQNTFCWWNHFSASAGSRKEGWIALSPSTFALRATAGQVALRNDGKNGTRHRILAARSVRGVADRFAQREQRAPGHAGVQTTRSRAWCVVSTRVSHHRYSGIIRLSPRNGFNGLIASATGVVE